MRKTKTITIPGVPSEEQGQRDNGKTFLITEMPAFQAEEWANRATIALAPRISREVSPEYAEAIQENPSMPSMARVFALLSGISFPELKPLMDEMMGCVQIIPDPARPMPRALGLGGSPDLEEVETIRLLREEAINIHVGFTLAATIFNLIAVASTTPVTVTT